MELRTDEGKSGRRWFQRFSASESRKSKRRQTHGLVAYYWDGGASVSHPVREISLAGLYVVTDQRWYPGTLVTMTLQRPGLAATGPERSIMVQAKVVRSGTDGVAFALIMPEVQKQHRGQNGERTVADRKALEEFLEGKDHLQNASDLGER